MPRGVWECPKCGDEVSNFQKKDHMKKHEVEERSHYTERPVRADRHLYNHTFDPKGHQYPKRGGFGHHKAVKNE